MKHLNKTIFATTLLSIFMFGQPVLADTPDHNEAAASNVIISHDKQHTIEANIFGDIANHEGYAGGHSVGDASHGASSSEFTSAEHHAIKQMGLGSESKRK